MPYFNLDQELVAADIADIQANGFTNAVDVDENGSTVASNLTVWTGTALPAGMPVPVITCSDWDSGSSFDSGQFGTITVGTAAVDDATYFCGNTPLQYGTKHLEFIYERKEEMEKLSKQDDICTNLKKSLEVFHKSSSPRKKKLMELVVPKLVVDRKKDELNFYINPLLDKSLKNSHLPIDAIEPVLVLKPNFQDRKNSGSIVEDAKNVGENCCHIEEKSTFSGQLAEVWSTLAIASD